MSFVLPGLRLSILKAEKLLQFRGEKLSTYVIPAQEVKVTQIAEISMERKEKGKRMERERIRI